jgi:DnaJ-class molecular chaperone
MNEAEFQARIEQIYADLERYSYYELLNLPQSADPDEIRAAFHRMALSLHPDRHHTQPDPDLRTKVYAIYKRVTEGYKVLSESTARKEYDAGLAAGQTRLVRIERQRTGPMREEDTIDHPQAKKFFQLALAAERRGDAKTAKLNYTFALNLIGDHPVVKDRLSRLEKEGK